MPHICPAVIAYCCTPATRTQCFMHEAHSIALPR